MLIRFTTENFLSFNELVDFNLIASEEKQHQHHVIKGRTDQDSPLLKTSILYGANASGKSNLIRAMAFAQICDRVEPVREFALQVRKVDE